MLPEHRALIESAENPMMMWIELHLKFDDAVERSDWPMVRRILRLAAWCVSDGSGRLPNDTSTAAAVAFYEHLPTKREYWPHFRAWLSPQEFEALIPVFAYLLSADELAELKESYAACA
jgi:hypothetical protein